MIITTDDNHLLQPTAQTPDTGAYAVYVDGEFGGAAAKLVYKSGDNYIDYDDGVMISGDQVKLNKGIGVNVYLNVSGATGTTAINARCAMISA